MERPQAEPNKGTVKFFDPYDGYGYIIPEGKSADTTVFFERANIDPASYDHATRPGALVTYALDPDQQDHASHVVAEEISSAAS
jgi:cold shock CspA family protein